MKNTTDFHLYIRIMLIFHLLKLTESNCRRSAVFSSRRTFSWLTSIFPVYAYSIRFSTTRGSTSWISIRSWHQDSFSDPANIERKYSDAAAKTARWTLTSYDLHRMKIFQIYNLKTFNKIGIKNSWGYSNPIEKALLNPKKN